MMRAPPGASALTDGHDGIWFMAEIEESLARVMAWLAANAPAGYATLSPPAPPAELDACERELGMALPAELRPLLLVSNDGARTPCRGSGRPSADCPTF
jgi:cell wall assembly regulator SMI1